MSDVRPPVEPMSDLSWARVERGLWARLDGTQPIVKAAPARRRWLWIAVPSVAVAATAAATFALLVDTPGSIPTPVTPTAAKPVEVPTRIVSGAAPSTITHGDAHVSLDADSAVVMSRETETAVLERGGAWFAIPQRTGRPFVVIAGDAVVRVVDTRFRIARFAEHTTIEVDRGFVDVTFQGSTVKLRAGQTWSSQPQPQPQPAQREQVVAADARAEAPRRAAKRIPVVADARERERAWYRYTALEVKDPSAAFAGYLDLARGTDTWAANSLYSAGRLAVDRGEAERANTLLHAYLRRFPRGANATDARQLLDRLKGAP